VICGGSHTLRFVEFLLLLRIWILGIPTYAFAVSLRLLRYTFTRFVCVLRGCVLCSALEHACSYTHVLPRTFVTHDRLRLPLRVLRYRTFCLRIPLHCVSSFVTVALPFCVLPLHRTRRCRVYGSIFWYAPLPRVARSYSLIYTRVLPLRCVRFCAHALHSIPFVTSLHVVVAI